MNEIFDYCVYKRASQFLPELKFIYIGASIQFPYKYPLLLITIVYSILFGQMHSVAVR